MIFPQNWNLENLRFWLPYHESAFLNTQFVSLMIQRSFFLNGVYHLILSSCAWNTLMKKLYSYIVVVKYGYGHNEIYLQFRVYYNNYRFFHFFVYCPKVLSSICRW